MPQDAEDDTPEPEDADSEALTADTPRGRRRRTLLWIVALFLVVAGLAWLNREKVADRLITDQLKSMDIPAQYEIKEIGAGRQVLQHVVIGDPAHPDLTLERVEVRTVLRFGLPRFDDVRLVKPRLFGSFREGKLSFGSLDPLIFTDSEEPFELPDLGLAIEDGRGLIESDFGPVGIKAEGRGRLQDGFAGILAVNAPRLSIDGCEATGATLFGKLAVSGQRPRFEGPLRLSALDCEELDLHLAKSEAKLTVTADRTLDGGDGKLSLSMGQLQQGSNAIRALGGDARLTFRKDRFVADYDFNADGVASPQATMASLRLDGSARSQADSGRIEFQAGVTGSGLSMGRSLERALVDAAKQGEGTLVQPVLDQIRTSFLRESKGSVLNGNFILRNSGQGTSLVVPQAAVKSGSGQTLLSLSRMQVGFNGDAGVSVTGNFATGGRGLPVITGRMEGAPGARFGMNIRMPEYRAGTASLGLPRLVIVQQPGGAMGFAGEALLSGEIPGGRVDGLSVPLDGNWSSRAGLAMWRKCARLDFRAVQLSDLKLQNDFVTICPPRGSAIVRSGPGGVRAIAGLSGVVLTGRLGSSPIRIASGPAAVSWPGKATVRDVDVRLGPAGYASEFRIGRLDALLDSSAAGRFEKADVRLDAVPLDVLDAAGAWRFADGVLDLSEGSFRLEDRKQVDRFQPLVAQDADLRLADNLITAQARLREPESLREIVRSELRHDLSTGIGSADLYADGVRFDADMQPDTLSYLALGVIANARGEVRGTGRIDWSEENVSSTGLFTTDALDFAAAFGPVKGLSGTVEFTDLLGLVTAADQRLHIAAINPGIEVNDGLLTFQMDPGYVLSVKGAKWPFLGGDLTLLPVDMAIGSDDVLRYTLVMEGLDAARFLERIEMENLSATGRFEGRIPLVFDEDGGRIEGGHLVSLPPGGNVAYIGDLTYEDLSAMGNFAFDALRSLDYRRMEIDLDGSLEGEIITRVTFDGLGQGQAARRNFLTKQVAKLPIRFKVNVRAPFLRLVTSVRSLYDAEYLRNPETLGLVDLPVPPGEVIDRTTPPD